MNEEEEEDRKSQLNYGEEEDSEEVRARKAKMIEIFKKAHIKPNLNDSENDPDILKQEIELGEDEVNSYVEEDDAKWKDERNKVPKYVLRHNGKFRMRWDLVIIVFTLYNCINIPYEVAFSKGFSDHVAVVILDYCID